ncbi:hypothetical protein Poli38472_001362 [Pythium oligandrum]|uniref:S-adenosyl-L-methionine-dependent methyltransferase n=1 Tax=Pythium oligandrum TaxID=41045 RepID=A0A8K1CV56_PYTOL|nr:hypothetical protein Poli38472_001362 [Pythium oligandrum]|eukprot:TMW69206.1 hypothetical protein Poli38472_001362 [Pythium oligandrum]
MKTTAEPQTSQDKTEESVTPYTCMMTAYLRGAETKRDDAICNDPYAEALGGDAGRELAAHVAKLTRREDQLSDYIVIRTRFIDETLANRDPVIQQVVMLGAGLDARAYRMKALADCRVIEMDASTEMLDRKRRILSEMNAQLLAKEHHVVVVDLADESWTTELLNNGFNPMEPTFWLLEGLLQYIDYDSNVRLIKTLDRLSAPNSQIWLDLPGRDAVTTTTVTQDEKEGFWRTRATKYGENNPQEGVLSVINWDLRVTADFSHPADFYGRQWVPLSYTSSQGEEKVVPMFFVQATKPASP